MLAHALEAGASVVISYHSKTGTHTTREIRPRSLYGRWLDSWCCLRQDQRDFTVARIEAVSPV
jgi:predicted DNA-binding transcriptional regulator YafY